MTFILPLVIIFVLLSASVKIIQEYERGVVFRLGRITSTPKGPGVALIIPIVDKMTKVSLRTLVMDIDPQDVITKDNVTIKVNAVLNFKVIDPTKTLINVDNYLYATTQSAQTNLRSVVGQHTLDDLLCNRDVINNKLQEALDSKTDPWGIKVSAVEVKDIDLPDDMKRAMAKEAEAERTRRAKIIAAVGEAEAAKKLSEAAKKLSEAADEMAKSPAALQLRYLQTMADIATKQSTTTFMPIPLELFKGFNTLINK